MTAAERELATEVSVAIAWIKIEDRHRVDLGKIEELAESIADIGLINPVTLTSDYRLIAGGRRIAAYQRLGRTHIQARVTDQFSVAVDRLKAERDENQCRKEMTVSEKVALGRALEELERPAARERQLGNLRRGDSPLAPHGANGESEEFLGKVSLIVAPALDMSSRTYERAKNVIVTAEDETQPDEVREIAREAIKSMDAGGSITIADQQVVAAKKRAADPTPPPAPPVVEQPKPTKSQLATRITELAGESHSSRQIAAELGLTFEYTRGLCRDFNITVPADEVVGRTKRADSNRVLNQIVLEADALLSVVRLVEVADLDRDRLEEWANSLSQSLRSLNKFANTLKKELASHG